MYVPYNFGKGKAFKWLADRVGYQGDECLTWPFCLDGRCGRGRLGVEGKHYWAHRLMCEMAHGPQPIGLECAHSCGNGHLGCVNPKHLSWQTRSQNHLDRRKHGTHATSTWGPKGKLSSRQRAEILALKGKHSQVKIGEMFDVSFQTVGRLHRRAS